MQRTPRVSPTASLSHRWVRATSHADCSTDLYFGSQAPAGTQVNWLATVPGGGYFAILRLYGPTEAAFDKSWTPGDFEKVK